jgi:hypothetical protein
LYSKPYPKHVMSLSFSLSERENNTSNAHLLLNNTLLLYIYLSNCLKVVLKLSV